MRGDNGGSLRALGLLRALGERCEGIAVLAVLAVL